MAQNLLLALQITAIGMGLVFGSIILFWLLMAAMVRLTNAGLLRRTNHKVHQGHEGLADAGQLQKEGGHPLRRRAAAVAVAVALTQRGGAVGLPARPALPSAQASAWQVVQRAKSLRIFPRGRTR